jgi:HEAT repeat protein
MAPTVSLQDRSSAWLLEQALQAASDPEDELAWERYLDELHRRPDDETFELALECTRSEDPARRATGVHVLGKLGTLEPAGSTDDLEPAAEGDEDEASEPAFAEKTVPALWALLDDPSPDVVAAAVLALGNFDVDDHFDRFVPLTTSQHAQVRLAVATTVAGTETPVGIELLARLTRDPEDEVRNWATFGLGTLCEIDTPEVRAALFDRLDDSHAEVRGEALLGLALRQDERAASALERELASDEVTALAVEAARASAWPGLLPALRELQTWWDPTDEVLEEAVRACRDASRGS